MKDEIQAGMLNEAARLNYCISEKDKITKAYFACFKIFKMLKIQR